MIRFTVPGRPQPKQRPRVCKNGYTYTPKETVEYEERVIQAAQFASGYISGPIVMVLWVYMPIPKSWSKAKKEKARQQILNPTSRPDIDNLAKAIMDALNGIVYKDDAQIIDLIVHKRYSDNPRVEVVIEKRK